MGILDCLVFIDHLAVSAKYPEISPKSNQYVYKSERAEQYLERGEGVKLASIITIKSESARHREMISFNLPFVIVLTQTKSGVKHQLPTMGDPKSPNP